MKKFKFRLERIRQFRQLVKLDKQRELVLRNALLFDANQQLTDLQQAALLNHLEQQAELTAEEVQLRAIYGVRLKAEISKQAEVVEECEQEVAEARERYIAAAQEAETLEALKRKKLIEYRDYLSKEEGKFIDELTTQRAKRAVGIRGQEHYEHSEEEK